MDELIDRLIAERDEAIRERDEMRKRYAPQIAQDAVDAEQKRIRDEIAALRAKANLLEKRLLPKTPVPQSGCCERIDNA